MQKINMNGKEFRLPELGFKQILQLEEMNVNILEAGNKPMNFMVGILSLATGDFDSATNEVEAFITSGGDLNELMAPIMKAIEDSGFFRALAKKANKNQKADTQ